MRRPLHVVIVGRALSHRVGGVREYARSISEEMLALESPHRFSVYYAERSMEGFLPAAEEVYLKAPHKFLWDHVAVPRQLNIDRPDVV